MDLHLAVFGIHNSTLNTVIDLLLLVLVVIWVALIYWTWADAHRRIADPMLVGCAAFASLFPFVGSIVYTIVRPPEYLEDVRERELEIQAAEARLADLHSHFCPHCDAAIDRDFLRCPHCMRKLKDPCASCGRPLDPRWRICPFCEAETAAGAPVPRRSRRRRELAGDPALDAPAGGSLAPPAFAEAPRARAARRSPAASGTSAAAGSAAVPPPPARSAAARPAPPESRPARPAGSRPSQPR
jgi:hypothetical protein